MFSRLKSNFDQSIPYEQDLPGGGGLRGPIGGEEVLLGGAQVNLFCTKK